MKDKTKERSHATHGSHGTHTPNHSTAEAQYAAMQNGTQLFDQAIKSYEQALRTGVRLQEDTARFWTNILNQASWQQEWQKHMHTMVSEAIPTAQKNVEDSLRLLDQSSKTGLSMLKVAVDGTRGHAAANVQSQVQELWQSSLNVLQSNMQAITESQAKVMESWTEFMRRGLATTSNAASSATRAAEAAAAH